MKKAASQEISLEITRQVRDYPQLCVVLKDCVWCRAPSLSLTRFPTSIWKQFWSYWWIRTSIRTSLRFASVESPVLSKAIGAAWHYWRNSFSSSTSIVRTLCRAFELHFIENDLLLYPTFRKENYKAQLAARDSLFVEILEGIPFENESPEKRRSIFQILSDLWLSRLNIDTVFTPTFNETISISRFGSPHLLDPVFEFRVLQTLLRIVIVSWKQSKIDRDRCWEAGIAVVLPGFDHVYGESVCESIAGRTAEKSPLFGTNSSAVCF